MHSPVAQLPLVPRIVLSSHTAFLQPGYAWVDASITAYRRVDPEQ